MAGNRSNADLRAEIVELSKLLGDPDPELEGKKNTELAILVADLRARLPLDPPIEPAAEPAEPEASEPASAPAPAVPAALGLGARRKEPEVTAAVFTAAVENQAPASSEVQTPHEAAAAPVVRAPEVSEAPAERPWQVAKGRSCTSLRGILGPGTVVEPKDFRGGEQSLADMVRLGVVVRK